MLREWFGARAAARRVLAAALVATLVACGGSGGGGGTGGGGGGGGGGTPLAISAQPADANVVAGDPATFGVVAAGTGTLDYQWSREGVALTGATAATYTLASAALADGGVHFTVRVSDGSGGVDSTAARLGVRSPITTPPASVTVAAGATATFSVVAEGHALSYQWQRDGVDIAGATAATYTTPAVTAGDNGAAFRVRVTNGSVSVLSEAAVLTVGASTSGVRPLRLAAGIGFSLGQRADGKVLVWGVGDSGSNTPAAVPGTPVPGSAAKVVTGLAGVAQVVADNESLFSDALAIDGSGQTWRWGYGDTLLVTYASPTLSAPLSPAVSIARCTGGTPKINIVLRADGTLWFGGTTLVTGIDHVVSLSELGGSGSLATCTPYAVKSDGTVWSILVNAGRTAVQSVSVVAGLPAITQVSCGGGNLGGGAYCLARAADGTVWAWGGNGFGQLGNDSTTGSTIPLQVPGLTGIARVVAGTTALSMALGDSGVLYTWGLGSGRASPENPKVPLPLAGWTDVRDIAAGFGFGLALRADGSVWGWGSNASGELGDGTTAQRDTPVRAVGINLN